MSVVTSYLQDCILNISILRLFKFLPKMYLFPGFSSKMIKNSHTGSLYTFKELSMPFDFGHFMALKYFLASIFSIFGCKMAKDN